MEGSGRRETESGVRLLAALDHPAGTWAALCSVLVLLTLFGVSDILLAGDVSRTTRRVLATSNVLAHLSYAALAPVLLHVLRRHPLRKGARLADLAWHAATALALGGIATLVMQLGLHLTVRPLASVEAVLLQIGRTYRYNLHDVFFVYALLAATAATLDLFRRERRRSLDAVALGRELTATHLEALRVRVDPHFLFNTLNALLPLVATRPDAACDAVVRLGTLLRFGFRHAPSGLVPLREEAEYLSCFLVLEELRVSDRLSVLVDFSPDVLDAAVPALALKPFVEAALSAGVFRRTGSALLEVTARREGGEVVVRVKSRVRGAAEPGAVPADDAGIDAAAERIARAFGPRGSVRSTWSAAGDLDAEVRFPRAPVPPAALPATPSAPAPPRPLGPVPAPRTAPPLDRPLRLAALAAVLWLGSGLYLGSQAQLRTGVSRPARKPPAVAHYGPPFVRAAVWALLTPAVLLLYRRRPLSRRPLFAVPVHLLAATAAATVVVTTTQLVLAGGLAGLAPPRPLAERLARELPGEAGTYLLLASVLLVLDVARRARVFELRSARLEANLAEARLAALRTQLHPHFLFNTLNGLLPLIRFDPEAAARTLVRLGDLLRAGLEGDATHLVPLSREIDFLRRYLEIEATRFRDRLSVAFEVADDALGAAVPSFVLQPLVENAVKHGVSRCPGPATLTVSARRVDGSLAVEVRNEAPGAEAGPPPLSDGVGLSNVRSRLAQLFGDAASLEAGPSGEDGFRALLRIPFAPAAETRVGPRTYPEGAAHWSRT